MNSCSERDVSGVLDRRRAGVLLHPTSLPSAALGADAVRFLDFLNAAGFSVWQMLPLGPSGMNGSPYSLLSAFAGSPRLVPPALKSAPLNTRELDKFRQRETFWLEDFAVFSAIRRRMRNQPWWKWPADLRDRQPASIRAFCRTHQEVVTQYIHQQFRFHLAWQDLRDEARNRGVLLFGDMPMFVMADSADVWARPHGFRLDRFGRPAVVAGVPPDAFSATGQCWGNPVYDWKVMQAERFEWWHKRVEHELRRFDLLRWDHFRGLVAGWEIATENGVSPVSAAGGHWHEVPGRVLLHSLQSRLGPLPVVAENLGIITPEVEQLRRDFGLPGMHVMQFAFDNEGDGDGDGDGDDDEGEGEDGVSDSEASSGNPHLPQQHELQGVAYSGTHDNNTTVGWFSALKPEQQRRVLAVLDIKAAHMPDAFLQTVLASRCLLAVLPMQDLLRLGQASRLNTPGVAAGQWRWQFAWPDLDDQLTRHWRTVVGESRRSPAAPQPA